jgi:hypothetical protein
MPFVRGAHLRGGGAPSSAYSVGLANSPVNGLLYVRGSIGAGGRPCPTQTLPSQSTVCSFFGER